MRSYTAITIIVLIQPHNRLLNFYRIFLLNTARSALSLIINWPNQNFGEHKDVKKFMKGVNNMRPVEPRYTDTWDPDLVLNLFLSLSPAKKLSIELLTMKTVVLVLLVSGKRPQIIRNLTVDHMKVKHNAYEFQFKQHDLKEGRLNYKPDILTLSKYPVNKKLCVHHYLTTYLERTLDMRGKERSLFLTLTKPHKKPSSDTVSRWIKKILRLAGISDEFSAGSTRAAVTSKAERGGVPIDDIMRAAGWVRQSTFTKFYNKPIKVKEKFQNVILKL
jgi:hypothetical protein